MIRRSHGYLTIPFFVVGQAELDLAAVVEAVDKDNARKANA